MAPDSWVKCRTSIMRHEGFRSRVYTDSLGNATIGYGHLLTSVDFANNLTSITLSDAQNLLDQDMANAESEIIATWPAYSNCDDCRQSIVLEMCYQLGCAGFMQFTRLREAIIAKDYVSAEIDMLASLWAKQAPNRVQDLAYVMQSGNF